MIQLRNHSSALTYGELENVDSSNPAICAFLRTDEKESLLVIHNLSGKKQSFNLSNNLQGYGSQYYAEKEAKVNNGQVEIPEYSMVILRK